MASIMKGSAKGILTGMLIICLAGAGGASAKGSSGNDPTPQNATGIMLKGTDKNSEVTDEGEGKSKKKATKKGRSVVDAAIRKLHPFNSHPMKGAKYFVYLQSASWCKWCCQEMPKIVEEYPEMKKAKIEIVLLGHDSDKRAAQNYLKKYRAKFPGVMVEQCEKLPGYVKSNSVPHVTFVDADGYILRDGGGSVIMAWRDIISQASPEAE